jgi:hypothetical protein
LRRAFELGRVLGQQPDPSHTLPLPAGDAEQFLVFVRDVILGTTAHDRTWSMHPRSVLSNRCAGCRSIPRAVRLRGELGRCRRAAAAVGELSLLQQSFVSGRAR